MWWQYDNDDKNWDDDDGNYEKPCGGMNGISHIRIKIEMMKMMIILMTMMTNTLWYQPYKSTQMWWQYDDDDKNWDVDDADDEKHLVVGWTVSTI